MLKKGSIKEYLKTQFSPWNGPKIHLYRADIINAEKECKWWSDDLILILPYSKGRVVERVDGRTDVVEIKISTRINESSLLVPIPIMFQYASSICNTLMISSDFALHHFDELYKHLLLFHHIAFSNYSKTHPINKKLDKLMQ